MPIETHSIYVILTCVLLVYWIGYYMGRCKIKDERELILQTLSGILKSADELSCNVDGHNTELADMGRTVKGLSTSKGHEVERIQEVLVDHIRGVITSNRKLEDDLVCARYTLEKQAFEIDESRKEARMDALSQLDNRKSFDETYSYWLSQWNRRGRQFAIMLVDVDHFKWINDTHGHKAGDYVVQGVGTLLKKEVGRKNYVARYGGDEFVLLVQGKDQKKVVEFAEQIRAASGKRDYSASGRGERVAITFSIGLAFARKDDTAESLFQRADDALYAAKDAGRNCLRLERMPLPEPKQTEAQQLAGGCS